MPTPPSLQTFRAEDYDLVIVGAGAAGAVIASRVTENPDRRVLLLEAGPDYNEANLPADLRDGTRNALMSHGWNYHHQPAPNRVRFPMPRGRVVGGSSAVNTCIALRGMPWDYDEWAALGLPEWSWEHCLPAFKRMETDHDVQNEWHGTDGPLPVRRHTPEEWGVWQRAFIDACKEVGYPAGYDSNDPTTTGYGPHAMNKLGGQRISAARAWLTPAVRARPNLTLLSEVEVSRIRFHNREVSGLDVRVAGQILTWACKRVILCAGALQSPTILLRSGVGPRDTLSRLGIEQVVHNPGVGIRLLDHPGAALFAIPKPGVWSPHDPLIQTVCRFTSQLAEGPNDMLMQPGSFVPYRGNDFPLMIVMTQVGKPRGHGKILWDTVAMDKRPRIESRLLVDDHDRSQAIEGLERAWEVTQTSAMRHLGQVVWPPPTAIRRRDRLDSWVRRSCDSGYHPSGTVPMGPDTDPFAATDGRGVVRGVTGLTVADASLMPTIPTSNIHLPTLMMAERFGEWLRPTGA